MAAFAQHSEKAGSGQHYRGQNADDAGAVAADGLGKPAIHRLVCYHC